MNKLFARITIEKTEIGAKIRYLESAVLFLSYSYGLSLAYGYLISPLVTLTGQKPPSKGY